MNPLRITPNQACELLSIKRNALRNLMAKDKSFPKPYKCGISRQSPVYFDYADLVKWHQQKKAQAYAMQNEASTV